MEFLSYIILYYCVGETSAEVKPEFNIKQRWQSPWGRPFYLRSLNNVSLPQYNATAYRNTGVLMTNIRGLRHWKKNKATQIFFCPWAKPWTALWAISEFCTGWYNAASHALALALQLEQALRILSPKLIIHSYANTHTARHASKHWNMACLLQHILFAVSYLTFLYYLKDTNVFMFVTVKRWPLPSLLKSVVPHSFSCFF